LNRDWTNTSHTEKLHLTGYWQTQAMACSKSYHIAVLDQNYQGENSKNGGNNEGKICNSNIGRLCISCSSQKYSFW
jgi:hypothetical protein